VAAGCASDNARQRQAYAYPGMTHVAPPVPRQPAPRVEVEDDGLPAQAPPMRKRGHEPDDPTEPFSPNYGTVPPRAQASSPANADDAAGSGDGRRGSDVRRNASGFDSPSMISEPPHLAHSRISTSAIAQRR
jgi:hypothetical protein